MNRVTWNIARGGGKVEQLRVYHDAISRHEFVPLQIILSHARFRDLPGRRLRLSYPRISRVGLLLFVSFLGEEESIDYELSRRRFLLCIYARMYDDVTLSYDL